VPRQELLAPAGIDDKLLCHVISSSSLAGPPCRVGRLAGSRPSPLSLPSWWSDGRYGRLCALRTIWSTGVSLSAPSSNTSFDKWHRLAGGLRSGSRRSDLRV